MSAQKHVLEYAKSGRAKCHGACRGSLIPKGALRYGQKYIHEQYGESVSWMHWECAGKILGKLAAVRLDNIPGFCFLRPEDQDRIRQDVNARKIGSCSPPMSSPSSKSLKCKTESSPSQPLTAPSSSQSQTIDEAWDEYFDESLDEAKDELYVSLVANVVGLQYYKGLVGPGEEVTLVREPHNQYDRNAIQVLNISGTQVGHIPRNVASKLAPLIDRNLVIVEGIIHEGNLNRFEYSISLSLKIYGSSHKRDQLEPLLVWATPRQRGFTDAMRPASSQRMAPVTGLNITYTYAIPHTPIVIAGPSRSQSVTGVSTSQRKFQEDRVEALQKAAELRAMLSSLERIDDEGRRSSLLDSVCTADDILNLPEHPSPPGVASGELTVDLLRHQSQALQWCIEHENPSLPERESDKPVQFWQFKSSQGNLKGYYLNLATKTPREARPALGRGGLLADAMGLGKTLSILALVVATKKDVPTDFNNATLIVVPLSVLSNWKIQISEHCASRSITYHVYYDSGRNVPPEDLSMFDIVLTTYQVVTQDYSLSSGFVTEGHPDGKAKKRMKINGGLFEVKWKRIVLDEGHTIRNSKTKMAIAARGLVAQRRWVVTGTPIINSPKDLGSLLQFLQICHPLDNEDYYRRLLLRPLAQGAPEGAELLKALMSHICIRRTKEMQNSKGEHLVPLPPVEMTLIPVQLDTQTRELYDEIESLSQERLASYIGRHGVSCGRSMPTNVLSLLTRLRQLTLHPGLIPHDYVDQLRSMSEDPDQPASIIHLTPEDRSRLSALLARAIEDREECPICFDITVNPRITPCAHIFCFACISEALSRDPKCPMDRRIINLSDLIEPSPLADLTQAPLPDPVEGIRIGSSAKIDQLVHLLQLTPTTEKSLVFSQFTGFLDKIAEALKEKEIPYIRFDGQMSARRRQEALERFSQPLEAKGTPPLAKRPRRSTVKVVIDSDDDEPQGSVSEKQSEDDSSLYNSDGDNVWKAKKGKWKMKEKGKGKMKPNRRRQSDVLNDCTENPVVMLISLKAGALGLNLTVANNVYLMDPWWQEGIESQAIDRCNRIGQTKPVHVYQLVAEKTVEAKVLEIQERKKKLIKQAFSGTKTIETQRQKKEARLQDLIEVFGIRRGASVAAA